MCVFFWDSFDDRRQKAGFFLLRASYLRVSAGRLQPVPLLHPATLPAFMEGWSGFNRIRFYRWENYDSCDCSLHLWCLRSSISSASSGQVMAVLVPLKHSWDLETAQKHTFWEALSSGFMLHRCFAIDNPFAGAMKCISLNRVLNRMLISIETIPLPLA